MTARHLWLGETLNDASVAKRIHHQLEPMELYYEFDQRQVRIITVSMITSLYVHHFACMRHFDLVVPFSQTALGLTLLLKILIIA